MLLRYDATEPEYVTPANGRKFTLKELQDFVGGFIEVPMWVNDQAHPRYKEMLLVANVEGIPLRLPRNDLATRVAIVAGAINPDSCIYGNALLVHSKFID